jgi:hypothetical protein
MEFYSFTQKNEILSFTGKWIELENIILSGVSQAQRPKAKLAPSCEDYRPTTNAAMLWDTGHTKGRPCTGAIGQEKGTKNLNMVDVLPA